MQHEQNLGDVEQYSKYWESQVKQETIENTAKGSNQPIIKTNQYPIPRAIIGEVKRLDFPIDELPHVIRDAVIEVENYVQAPTALVASSILGIVSGVCQGLIKVRRDNTLVSPVSLYLLLIAEPNERKSKVESYFRKVIEEWEVVTQKAYAQKHHDYDASMVAYESKRLVIEKSIRANANDSTKIKEFTKNLSKYIAEQPIKPLSPKMLIGDATKEALTKTLDEGYPSASVISAEGGGILAGALTRDGLTGVLATLNSLWSGEIVTINRSGDGDRVLNDVALTLSLAVQEAVITEFLTKGQEMARGIGFLARTLFCFPESTQGHRLYKEPPEKNIAVDALNDRLILLIAMQEDHIENRRLKRDILKLDDEAKTVWIEYYNKTEAMQCRGETLEFLRDVAGKTADNATRIAGLFHLIDSDKTNAIDKNISAKNMRSGADIAEYYLHEALNYLGMSDLPSEFKQAQEVSERLISYCLKRKANPQMITDGLQWNEITKREIQRVAPRRISALKTLMPIINELLDADHIVGEAEAGKTVIYRINPRLVV